HPHTHIPKLPSRFCPEPQITAIRGSASGLRVPPALSLDHAMFGSEQAHLECYASKTIHKRDNDPQQVLQYPERALFLLITPLKAICYALAPFAATRFNMTFHKQLSTGY
ncbi:MAG: hypothetical protein PHN85_00630, partial [Kiritimatiellae bacterium]|nr:hypothetical protein [Kiritimatiellia bacterium]